MSIREIRIATRKSALALWQAEYVKACLEQAHPGLLVSLVPMVSRGDKLLDAPLAKIGGKGLFVKELETALLDNEADIAVHSMKDVPMTLPPEFALVAIAEREVPLDAFVSNKYESLDDMPPGAVVGTSSLRRESQIHAQYPMLAVTSLRGNLDTRLRKLDEGQYDAIILAAAGLKRLGFASRIASLLEADESLPAPGQGALGIECREERDDVVAALSPLVDRATTLATVAERAFSRALGGSCHTPLGGYAQWEEGSLWLRGMLASRDGKDILRGEIDADVQDAAGATELGLSLADDFLSRGASRFLTP